MREFGVALDNECALAVTCELGVYSVEEINLDKKCINRVKAIRSTSTQSKV
jgi:hypothetical protein